MSILIVPHNGKFYKVEEKDVGEDLIVPVGTYFDPELFEFDEGQTWESLPWLPESVKAKIITHGKHSPRGKKSKSSKELEDSYHGFWRKLRTNRDAEQ